jgi:hypothetical protein
MLIFVWEPGLGSPTITFGLGARRPALSADRRNAGFPTLGEPSRIVNITLNYGEDYVDQA